VIDLVRHVYRSTIADACKDYPVRPVRNKTASIRYCPIMTVSFSPEEATCYRDAGGDMRFALRTELVKLFSDFFSS
jgi:hypothetical protein